MFAIGAEGAPNEERKQKYMKLGSEPVGNPTESQVCSYLFIFMALMLLSQFNYHFVNHFIPKVVNLLSMVVQGFFPT